MEQNYPVRTDVNPTFSGRDTMYSRSLVYLEKDGKHFVILVPEAQPFIDSLQGHEGRVVGVIRDVHEDVLATHERLNLRSHGKSLSDLSFEELTELICKPENGGISRKQK